ncbi:MAG: DUF87 domain-containing protein [Eubacterium sp.]|nr:DUF87 domain-containing protein [Eubacterium sp.]
MRLIPGKTKVKIELFKHVTIPDVIVGLIGLAAVTLCAVSSLPGRWIIACVVAAIFALLLFRLDDEPLYVFLWNMMKFFALPRRLVRVYDDNSIKRISAGNRKAIIDEFFGENENEENPENESVDDQPAGYDEQGDLISEDDVPRDLFSGDEDYDNSDSAYEDNSDNDEDLSDLDEKQRQKLEKKRLKQLIKEENKILKSKTATEEEKDAVWLARANRSAEKKKAKAEDKENNAVFEEMSEFISFTGIEDGYIEYAGNYYGTVIEIDPVAFRFFSKHRRDNSIENCLGKILRGLIGDYGANIVKIQRPIIYDKYLDAEYDKLDALKKSYESGLLTEEELQARVEIQYDRINEVRWLCDEEKVIDPFYYLVLFETDKSRLDTLTKQAVMTLEQGELEVRRLDSRGLALFLKYTNKLDFDEKEIDDIEEEQWANWAMPQDLKFTMRTTVIDGLITHNMRVISYPSMVGDSWLAGVMSFPSTKVVVKITPMDRTKSIRAIDRSLAELRGQYMATSLDSKQIELQEHINTLSSLLVTLQQDNEALLSVNIYITAYDAFATSKDPVLKENFSTAMSYVADMKKTLKRNWSEEGMRLSGMDFLQIQSFIGSQISAYDPMLKDARGIPANTIAGMFPWIFAHISDVGGIKLGSADGVPVFIDFFKRNEERVNSNMVIVGKSGSGKSYATKSLLTNLASEDAKIFILDPENEYSELAHTLHGKVINVGNAKFGRLNPFHIITALDDDEASEDGNGPSGSFATHLQFLEEFFRQILPDVDKEALEYLNSLVERVYLNFGITPETDISGFKPNDYPIFDDLYDVILSEFERTNNEYLRNLLRSLVNYISKFSTGGRNSNIWNGPSTVTTEENFSVFNFQSMLANRNSTIANAQMLLVLKYIDNEIIKNRDYNTKYGLKRKIVVVIDEAHVFIDTKYPIALDFMFQLAKRIRKYNGMQIVITQNIKDFVGSEDIARKSSAIINACQYSFVFGLAPNDMSDLCKLYEKAGGINETEQEDILQAKRGEAFTIMSPTSRSSFMIEVPDSFVDMFENSNFTSNYFDGPEGEEVWEDFVQDSREIHDRNYEARKNSENNDNIRNQNKEGYNSYQGLSFSEVSESEADGEEENVRLSAVDKMIAAEEYVNQKELQILTGRFGSINLQEVDESEIDNEEEETQTPDYYGDNSYEDESGYDSESGYDESGYEDESGYDDESGYGDESGYDYESSYDDESGYEEETGYGDESDEEDFDIELEEADLSEEDEEMAGKVQKGPEASVVSSFEDSVRRKQEEEIKRQQDEYARRRHEEELRRQEEDLRFKEESLQHQNAENASGERLYTQAELDRTLEAFRATIREEISRDLEDKLKWIALGAGLAGAGVQGAGAQGASVQEAAAAAIKSQETQSSGIREAGLQKASGISLDKPPIEDEKAKNIYAFEDEYSSDYNESEYSDGYDEDSAVDYSEDYSEDFSEDYSEDFSEDYSAEDEDLYIPDDDDEIFAPDSYEDDDYYSDNDDEDEDDEDDLLSEEDDFDFDAESEEYEPAPFLFAELLAEAADEYANMDLEERMEEMNEQVLEVTIEELGEYIKQQRKKNRN